MSDEETVAAAETLRAHGLKITPVRIGVLNVLRKSSQPLDAVAIHSQLANHGQIVTVHRTLRTLAKRLLIYRTRGDDQSWTYALREKAQPRARQYARFVCEVCGDARLLTHEFPRKMADSIVRQARCTVIYAEILLHGVCAKCESSSDIR